MQLCTSRSQSWGASRGSLPHRPMASLHALSRGRLAWVFRILPTSDRPAAGQGPLARDRLLATIEAALLAAEEPLAPRKLAEIAGVKDAGEARRLVKRLQSLYQQEDS